MTISKKPGTSASTAFALLAKSRSAESPEGVALARHLLDVASAVAALERRHPSIPEITGIPEFFYLLRTAAVLHDVGKAHPGFQAMLNGGARFDYRHEVFSAGFAWNDPRMSDEGWRLVRMAVLTHHKDLSNILGRCDVEELPMPEQYLDDAWRLVSGELLREAGLASASRAACPPSADAARSRIEGALRDAHRYWKGMERLRYSEAVVLTARFLRGGLIMADHAASAAKAFKIAGSKDLRVEVAAPYPHQVAAGEHAGNAVLTAPTGSGKTEAALLWAARQSSGGDLPLMFYVLPFQASLNAMRERLARHLPEGYLALQHGKALQALYLRLVNREYSPAAALAIARNEQNMARLHTSAVRILTPYQLLRGAYTLPGHESLWTVPVDSAFVFDEIHAYEPGRLAMILACMDHFANHLRSRVLVMTATMPSRLRRIVEAMLPGVKRIVAAEETFAQSRRHRLRLLAEELESSAVLGRIRERARLGEAVLIVANTVAKAQAMAAALRRDSGLPVALLHSRFHVKDRARIEQSAMAAAAVGGKRSGGHVLVATQVVEVSLNVDFDTIYTEAAPLEALLQRFGRVNRTPAPSRPLKDVHVYTKPASPRPYEAEEIELAMGGLAAFDGEGIDESLVQGVIDSVYDSAYGDRWEAKVRGAIESFRESVLASCKPLDSDEGLEARFEDLFDGFEVIPKGLRGEFESMFSTDALEAMQLLVPISKHQFGRLKRLGRMEYDGVRHVWLADAPYGEAGLELNNLQGAKP